MSGRVVVDDRQLLIKDIAEGSRRQCETWRQFLGNQSLASDTDELWQIYKGSGRITLRLIKAV